jgi:hypothetical protein
MTKPRPFGGPRGDGVRDDNRPIDTALLAHKICAGLLPPDAFRQRAINTLKQRNPLEADAIKAWDAMVRIATKRRAFMPLLSPGQSVNDPLDAE